MRRTLLPLSSRIDSIFHISVQINCKYLPKLLFFYQHISCLNGREFSQWKCFFFFIRVSMISKQGKTNYSKDLHVKHILSFKQYTADQSSFFFYFNKKYDDQVEGPSLASSIRSSAGSFADASSRTRMTTTVVMDQPSPDSTNFQNFRKKVSKRSETIKTQQTVVIMSMNRGKNQGLRAIGTSGKHPAVTCRLENSSR